MDMLLLVLAVQLYLLLEDGLRPPGRRSWLTGLAVFCGAGAAYSLFRWFYFHDVLPNTYYLKLTGVALTVRLLRGIFVFTDFLRDHLFFLLPVGLGTGVLMRRNARLALPAAVFALYCAYCVYTGGDSWDGDLPLRANRFIAFVMPLLFVLFNAVLNAALAAWRSGREERADPLLERFIAAGVTAVSLLLVNGLWLSSDADANWRRFTLSDRPPNVDRHERVAARLAEFRKLVQPGAVVATAWAGIPAYFSDYRMIDILGYNDRLIARMKPVVALGEDDFRFFRPGHLKWNEQRLFTQQRPDAFFQIWGVRRGMGNVTKVLPGYGYRQVGGFWMRTDSPFVHPAAAVAVEHPPATADVLDFHRKRRSKRAS
jgi:hypothetical protein